MPEKALPAHAWLRLAEHSTHHRGQGFLKWTGSGCIWGGPVGAVWGFSEGRGWDPIVSMAERLQFLRNIRREKERAERTG